MKQNHWGGISVEQINIWKITISPHKQRMQMQIKQQISKFLLSEKPKCWLRCEQMRNLICCWWESRFVNNTFWSAVDYYLNKTEDAHKL